MSVVISLMIVLCNTTSSFKGLAQPLEYDSRGIVDALSESEGKKGFKRAMDVRDFIFPDDAGPHPNFETEWWYYTGNLVDKEGRNFGYQLTFFRRALSPNKAQSKSRWATNQIYFAHFAVSDIAGKDFYPAEKWSRGAIGLAGALSNPFRVWIENWSAAAIDEETRLLATTDEAALDLVLKPTKTVVLHGNSGLSQKSAEPGNASYYYSQTRIETKGTLTVNGKKFEVSGFSWFDHEWSTSALGKKQSGWDWFSLQLDDGREIMLYHIRLKNGGFDRFSSGSLIERDGTVRKLDFDDFKIETIDSWTSRDTAIVYPSGWRITIPEFKLDFRVIPLMWNQELALTFVYWEGAVKISDENISGNGYVELTGYTKDKNFKLSKTN